MIISKILIRQKLVSTTFHSRLNGYGVCAIAPTLLLFNSNRHDLQTSFYSKTSFINGKDKSQENKKSEHMKVASLNASSEWRKNQLSEVTQKFDEHHQHDGSEDNVRNDDDDDEEKIVIINSDDELQPMWRSMESRVLNKRTMTIEEAKRKKKPVGRTGIRRTDEEAWLEAGLYDTENKK